MNPTQSVQEKPVHEKVKRPIWRSLLITMIIMFVIFCILISFLMRVLFERALYSEYNSRLTSVIKYVEDHANAEELKLCVETGMRTVVYDYFQDFVNGVIDDFDLDYLYVVIPTETTMVNVVSATSAAERSAGETDMPLLEETDAYSQEELARYRSYWNTDKINFFEESSEYGTFYTACKPLKTSNGETVALICADLLSSELHREVLTIVLISIGGVALIFLIFSLILLLWIKKTVTTPLQQLEESTSEFVNTDRESTDLKYNDPKINSKNEVGALSDSISKMTADIKSYISDNIEAKNKARLIEKENLLLAEKTESAAKIAEISQSISSLLNNMPALSFYKDAETGMYVACNQAFADYCHKPTPQDVVGHTDHEMFDRVTATHFVQDDKKALEMDEPYIFIEDVLDAEGNPRQFQTTKLKFTDTDGKLRLLGMCVDMTEMASIKRESEKTREAYEEAKSSSVTYSRIARALSTDYVYLYYINIVNDLFIEYSSAESSENLALERRGKDFFEEARSEAMTRLYRDDRLGFVSAFRKENVLETIKNKGTFTYTYRLLDDEGKPTYVSLKASKLDDDDAHIIIGINNVDAQMKYQDELERVQQERITYSRISALSGEFICIYTVDPITNHYLEYSATEEYEGLGIDKEGDDFFFQSVENGKRFVYYEDLENFQKNLNKENIINEIEKNGSFSMQYRLEINGEYAYVVLRAAIVKEKDGPQLIVGVTNIDAQVRKEQEFARNLSEEKSKANIDALTGVRNKHAYIDAESQLNSRIENGDSVEFALAVFDVNGLKIVNDTQGHVAGDQYLRKACSRICSVFTSSQVFRIGGDEFVVIAQGNDYDEIDELVKKIDRMNRDEKLKKEVVVACGMAKYNGEKKVAAVFEKADTEMYKNKNSLKGIE